MSSSIVTASTTTMTTAASNLVSSLPGNRPQQTPQQQSAAVSGAILPTMNAQFREIHKNTWLKRLTAEGKKICVGPKKSERSWVVFCVHDDTEAFLEGYAEPRQAPSHSPEWIVSMQDTLHISHALIPNSHEFEFVVTLSNEVVRFHAMSWDIMQEWVETLRSKLREMKILSPRENLYTKLPEVRAPLLPTRDPTSPLPAPPPVPAAIVPGVERVIPPSVQQQAQQNTVVADNTELRNSIPTSTPAENDTHSVEAPASATSTMTASTVANTTMQTLTTTSTSAHTTTAFTHITSMSNTLTQNLLNMLSDPISAYSEQLNDANSSSSSVEPDDIVTGSSSLSLVFEKDLNLSDTSTDEEFIGPLLRKPSAITSDLSTAFANNSVRLDVLAAHRASADQIRNLENILQCERYIPRPQTFRSLSAGAVDKSNRQNVNDQVESIKNLSSLMVANSNSKANNITELEISSEDATASPSSNTSQSNVTIIQVSTEPLSENRLESSDESDSEPPKLPHKTTTTIADVFKFPDTHVSIAKNIKQHEYKSNVQIIPSSSINSNSSSNPNHSINSSVHVISNSSLATVGGNQYTTPVKKSLVPAIKSCAAPSSAKVDGTSKITTVHVSGSDNTYGTCFAPSSSSSSTSRTSTPKMPKKIILLANTSGITNIAVNNTVSSEDLATEPKEKSAAIRKNSIGSKKDNDFATTSSGTTNSNKHSGLHYEKVFLSTTASVNPTDLAAVSSLQSNLPQSPKWNLSIGQSQSKPRAKDEVTITAVTKVPTTPKTADKKDKSQNTPTKNSTTEMRQKSPTQTQQQPVNQTASVINSPGMSRRRFVSPTSSRPSQPSTAARHPFLLTRGVTEAIITSRPSRRDFHFLNKQSATKTKSCNTNSGNSKSSNTANNNENNLASSTPLQIPTSAHLDINRTTSEALEQRRRSSSTSDAQTQRHPRSANNNDSSNRANAPPLRQPPQPFRLTENILGVSSSPGNLPTHNITSPAKRMTLREQQVMQLRREIMHPGGVRLQLRRKDCVGSIAWVDAFGAVWVAGWKQKEHPVLYNALHIGDQLLSIAGITISSAADANKIIRNTNTLFVEVLVRRIPFGRGYAIRREREGQCLGLIRDGNTATIVDVVPNSLAARHGLPPKAQSCDGSTLTFWVLTEINGRPLNLFFKENEIRDRLNSVGRDISILVQPSDLITKLKKQLKSLRSYKDYLVQ